MRKSDEFMNPISCWNKARAEEMLFILLARDLAAPATIRFWIQERIRLGKNKPSDAQLVEAEQCARLMESREILARELDVIDLASYEKLRKGSPTEEG